MRCGQVLAAMWLWLDSWALGSGSSAWCHPVGAPAVIIYVEAAAASFLHHRLQSGRWR